MARRSRNQQVELRSSLEERTVLVLFDLANHLQRRGEHMAARANITTLQWIVLLQIAGDPNFASKRRAADEPLLSSEIARDRGLSKPTISAVVTALKEQGLVREKPDDRDRRRRRLVLTASGARAIETIEPLRREANQALLADFDLQERRRLLDYLERCMAVLWAAYENDRVAAARARLARTR